MLILSSSTSPRWWSSVYEVAFCFKFDFCYKQFRLLVLVSDCGSLFFFSFYERLHSDGIKLLCFFPFFIRTLFVTTNFVRISIKVYRVRFRLNLILFWVKSTYKKQPLMFRCKLGTNFTVNFLMFFFVIYMLFFRKIQFIFM